MRERDGRQAGFGTWIPDSAVDQPPPPGEMAILLAALLLGILLMGIQLWLLTVALELYLGGQGFRVWQLALVSGIIFLGGRGILSVLNHRWRVRRTATR